MSELPAYVAVRRSGPSPGLMLLDPRADSTVFVVAEGDIQGVAWAPNAHVLAYQGGTDLCLYHPAGPHETLLTALVTGARRSFAFSPDGAALAALADGALFVLPVIDSYGPGRRVELPSDGRPFDVQWRDGMAGVVVSLLRDRRTDLLLVDLSTGQVSAIASGSEPLVPRHSDGTLVVRRPDHETGGGEAGLLRDGGAFEPLFAVPEGYWITDYLPRPDLFLVATTSEDGGDPVGLALVPSLGPPGTPWLEGHPFLSEWSFSPDGSLMAAIDATSGDVVLAEVGGEVIARMATPSDGELHRHERPVPADAELR